MTLLPILKLSGRSNIHKLKRQPEHLHSWWLALGAWPWGFRPLPPSSTRAQLHLEIVPVKLSPGLWDPLGGLDKKKMPSNKADTAKQQIDQYVFEVCKSAWKNCCYSSLIGVTATILAECIHQVSRVVWRNWRQLHSPKHHKQCPWWRRFSVVGFRRHRNPWFMVILVFLEMGIIPKQGVSILETSMVGMF